MIQNLPSPSLKYPLGSQVGLARVLWAKVIQEPGQEVWVPLAQAGGGALRSDTECSIPSYLLPHSTGGYCPLPITSR